MNQSGYIIIIVVVKNILDIQVRSSLILRTNVTIELVLFIYIESYIYEMVCHERQGSQLDVIIVIACTQVILINYQNIIIDDQLTFISIYYV